MILGIVQARSSSTRFPRKVLQPLLGEAMVLRQLERIMLSQNIGQVVVATSNDESDDELVDVLTVNGYEVRRGPLDDVVQRFQLVIDEFQPEHVVRLTADCPLADPCVIDKIIDEHLLRQSDYTSNVLAPTFPDGLDVEVFSTRAFKRLTDTELTPTEREHVTLGIYTNPERYSLWNVSQDSDHSRLRWTVDVPEDLEFVRRVYEQLYHIDSAFGQEEILDLLELQPALSRTSQDLARNAGLVKEK